MITEEETEARSLSVNLQASQNNSQEARETQGLEKCSVSDRIRSSLVDVCFPGCMRNKERVGRPTASFHPSVEVPVDKGPHQKQREVASNPGESR